MYNTFPYNTAMYNGNGQLAVSTPADQIVFNGYSLQGSDIISSILLHDSTPERSLETNDVPRGHGQFIVGDYWRRKTITVRGVIKKPTSELLEDELDNMKRNLAVREANFDINIGGNVRRYRATLTNGPSLFTQRQGYHITFCPFEAQFMTVEPFGHSIDYMATTLFDETSLVLNEQITNQGTITAKPVIILNFSAVSGVTAINFRNNTTGQEIELTKNINAGDYVKFDSENLEVAVNGVSQDYDGSFPLLAVGVNSITITITGTSATYTYTGKYLIPYL